MKTLYIVSENQVIDGDQELVEIKRFINKDIAERYIEKHQKLIQKMVYRKEQKIPKIVGQMSITQLPICETLEEAESEV